MFPKNMVGDYNRTLALIPGRKVMIMVRIKDVAVDQSA